MVEDAALSRSERAALSDEKLIRACVDLVAEGGIESTTLRSIGTRAGFSRGLVNYRFGTKEALLREAARRIGESWARDLIAGLGPDARGLVALWGFVRRHRTLLGTREHRAYYNFVYAALGPMPAIKSELAGPHNEIREHLAECIRWGVHDGDIRRDVNASVYATWVYASVRGIACQWLLDKGAFDLDRAHDDLYTVIERSLRP